MKYVSTTALTLWVSCATTVYTASPTLAANFYNDTCASRQGTDVWTLALSTIGDHAGELWREDCDNRRVRVGSYEQNGDDTVARVEDIRVHLHVASSDAAWSAGGAKGTFLCRCVGDAKPIRRTHAPVVASRDPDADDPFAAGAWARTPPPHYDEPPAPVTPWVSPATNA